MSSRQHNCDNITMRQSHQSQRGIPSLTTDAAAEAKNIPRDWEHLIDCSNTPWDLPQATEPLRRRREHRHHQHVRRQRQRRQPHVVKSLSPASNGDRQSSRRTAVHAHDASSRRGLEHRSRHMAASPSPSSSTAQPQPESRRSNINQPMWDGVNNGKRDQHHQQRWSDQCGARSASPSTSSSRKESRYSFDNVHRFAKDLTAKLPWKASVRGGAEARRRHSSGAKQNNNDSRAAQPSGERRDSLHDSILMTRLRGLFSRS